MSPTFSGGGFTMEVVNADDRDELIRVFTKYKVVPKKESNGWKRHIQVGPHA